MKKLLAVFILCAMLIAVLASCAQKEGAQKPPKGDNTQDTVDDNRDDGGDQNGGQTGFEDFKIPAGLSGADVAKLLLANERLNSQLLKNEGDIFENGAQVFRNLAETAEENLVLSAPTLIATPMRYKTLSPVPLAEIKDVGNEGIIEIDGNFYRWSGFEENNNSYEAFASMTEGIIHSSKMAAELIDNIKKNVRVVDKWVSYGDIKHYLHVDENSELLVELREDKEDTNLEICKRYKNESGKDVYELYVEYACERYVSYSRILYIPGQRYEFSTMHDLGEEVQENYFVADNSKGYWETYTVGVMPTHYNVSCFVMKDDISYDSFYDPVAQKINYLKVMSADRATDILHIMGDPADGTVFVELLFAGFNGVKNIEIEASADEIVTDLEAFYSLSREEQMKYKLYISNGYYGLVGNEAGTVNMANGKQLRFGDSFLDGKIKVDAIRASNSDVYNHGSIGLRVEAASCEQIVDYITAFIEEVGLECKRDTDETLAGISRAYTELAGFTSYYKWNGIVVDNEPAIDDAVVIEREKFGKLKALYEPVKNAEVIDFENKEQMELNVSFSDVEIAAMSGISASGLKITVENVALTVKDTLLFVKDEPYSVAFALIKTNNSGGLIHIGMSEQSVKFEADTITVSGGAELEIPHIAEGEYKLVAYVATSDGIRSTKYVALKADSADGQTVKHNNMDIVVSVGSDGELIVSSVENIDVTTEIHGKAGLTYAELRELVNVESYVFGNPVDALIEMMNAESQEYASMTGEETELTEGLYRAKYERKTDTGYSQGYIYFQLLLDVVEKPEETPEIKDENPEESGERPEEQGTA